MNKKIVVLTIIILLFIGGGTFWWWQSGKELRELNKDLPKEVRVIKSLTGEYVVNKKDGYKIKIPKEWGGLSEVEYDWDEEGGGLILTRLKDSGLGDIGIQYWKLKLTEVDDRDLESWIRETYGYPGTLKKEKIGNIELIRTGTRQFAGATGYFFKGSSGIYEVLDFTPEGFGPDIILNSKWNFQF